jgi:hypothetical protein
MTKDLGFWTAGDCALVLIDGLHTEICLMTRQLALEGSEPGIRVTGIDLVVDGGMKVW